MDRIHKWWHRRHVKTVYYNFYGPTPVEVFETLELVVPWKKPVVEPGALRMMCKFFAQIELLTLQVKDLGDRQTLVQATWHQKGQHWWDWGKTKRRGKWKLERLMTDAFEQEPVEVSESDAFAPLPERARLVRYRPHAGVVLPHHNTVECPHCGAVQSKGDSVATQFPTCTHCGRPFQHINAVHIWQRKR